MQLSVGGSEPELVWDRPPTITISLSPLLLVIRLQVCPHRAVVKSGPLVHSWDVRLRKAVFAYSLALSAVKVEGRAEVFLQKFSRFLTGVAASVEDRIIVDYDKASPKLISSIRDYRETGKIFPTIITHLHSS